MEFVCKILGAIGQ